LNGILIFAGMAGIVTGVLVVGGCTLAIGIATLVAIHLNQGRPRWYAMRVVRGGVVGAVSGLAVAVFVVASAQGGIAYGPSTIVLLAVAGFGWTAIGPARRLWSHRLESHAP
jgi:hypothetical protein